MIAVLILYLVPKYVAYAAWCYLGLKKFRPQGEDQQNNAYLYGFYRLLIGFVFGALVFLALAILAHGTDTSATSTTLDDLGIYFPVRWVEWTIMSVLIIPGSNATLRWLSGRDQRDRLWRPGGIGISFLADLSLLFLTSRIQVGRVLC
jgi:hypothetical protein